MRIKSQQDFFAGLMFTTVGVAFAWAATSFEIGVAARMGPGYFPLMLGILMAILGVVVTLRSIVVETEDGEKVGAFAWKPLGFIIAANLAIGVMLGGLPSIKLPAMGMIIGIYALTFIASLASQEFKFREVAILASVLAVASYLAFILLLKLQFQVWPGFLAG